MIQFRCKHCGRAFKVPDTKAGKKGHCPSCGEQVFIPVASEGDSATNRAGTQVPPPPAKLDTTMEEVALPADQTNASLETDILPADQDDSPPKPFKLRRLKTVQPEAIRAPSERNWLKIVILLAFALAAVSMLASVLKVIWPK